VHTVAKKHSKVKVERKGKNFSGFDDSQHPDSRCRWKRWGDRMAMLSDLDSVAFRAVGEHMTVKAFQEACMHAWNKALTVIDRADQDEAGDPPENVAAEKLS